MKNMLKDLKNQLVKKGVTSPEKYEKKISPLTDIEIDQVSGAGDPPMGFGQAFSQNSSGGAGSGFTQTIFTQTVVQ